MSDSVYIGSVTLAHPLHWIDRGVPTTLGKDVKTRSGDTVSIRVTSPSQAGRSAKLRFSWESWATVTALFNLWKAGSAVTMKPERVIQTTYTVRFAAENGVTGVKHVQWGEDFPHDEVLGHDTDLWDGEINVLLG